MGTFSLQIAEFARKAGANADLVVRKVGIAALTSVVKISPVDSGRFRANWAVSIGAPDTSVIPSIDPTGLSTIATGSEKLVGLKAGPSVYITNSLPYAERLEKGYSQQAPAGMVGITVAEFNDFIRDAVAQLP